MTYVHAYIKPSNTRRNRSVRRATFLGLMDRKCLARDRSTSSAGAWLSYAGGKAFKRVEMAVIICTDANGFCTIMLFGTPLTVCWCALSPET